MNKIIDTCPLNDAQKWMLKISVGTPVIDALTHVAIKINGKIDFDKLESALAALVARHDALRIVIEKDETGTYVNKLVDEWEEVKLNFVKLSDGTPEEKDAELLKIGNEISYRVARRDGVNDWKQPFDFTVFDFGNDEYVLFCSMLHLVTDGVSDSIVLNDIIALYNGMDLPPVTKSFMDTLKDYAKLSESEEGQKIINGWKEKAKNYDESFITFAADGHGNKGSFDPLTFLPLDKISSFTRKNKMSNAEFTLFLFHVALASLFGIKSTMIDSTNSFRDLTTRATVGCVVGTDVSMLEYSDEKTLPELLADFRERNQAKDKNILATSISRDTSFIVSYQNYMSGRKKKIMLDEAEVDQYTKFKFKKLWNYFGIIGIEAGDKLMIVAGSDPDVLTPEMMKKFASYLHSGVEALAEDTGVTFGEFRKTY